MQPIFNGRFVLAFGKRHENGLVEERVRRERKQKSSKRESSFSHLSCASLSLTGQKSGKLKKSETEDEKGTSLSSQDRWKLQKRPIRRELPSTEGKKTQRR